MSTPIAECLRGNGRLRVLFFVSAVLCVGLDFWFVIHRYPTWTRVLLTAGVLILYVLPREVDRRSLGLRLTPIQPVREWIRNTAIAAGLMLIPILPFWAFVMKFSIPQIPPDQAGSAFVEMCLIAPILEEPLYRLILCAATTAVLRPAGAIILSGAAFGALHFLYGNPAPTNVLAGFILAWAYLKSGSITVPIAFHALGNFVIFASSAAAGYLA